MNSDLSWTTVRLEDVAQEVTVGYVGPMVDEYRPTGIPFLRSKNIKPLAIDKEDLRYIDTAFHHKIRKSKLQPGDVVIVRTGAPGTTAVIPSWLGEANCSDLVVVRPSDRLNAHYFSYFMNAAANHQVDEQTVGAVQQHFNVGSAKQLLVPLPPRKEQDEIVEVLGSLDDRIELNRQMNRTLEAMAQAIFKSWFVDFDPVAAKVDGRKPYGMNDETAALFPAHYEESDLGPIPKGWTVKPVGDTAIIVGGGTPSTNEPIYWEGGSIYWTTPRDMARLQDPIITHTERKITAAGLAQISSGLLPKGTVLLSSRAPIGYVAITDVPLAINQGFIAIKCDGDLPNYYILNWLVENADVIESNANGTTFLEISKSNFRPIRAIVPGRDVLDKFVSIVAPTYERMTANIRESRTLAAVRDALLPKLLKGELRVNQTEKIVEGVA